MEFEEYIPPTLGTSGWAADTGRQVLAKSESNQPHIGLVNGALQPSVPVESRGFGTYGSGLYRHVRGVGRRHDPFVDVQAANRWMGRD